MARFRVTLYSELNVEVEAHTEDEAEALAYEQLRRLEKKRELADSFEVDEVYAE